MGQLRDHPEDLWKLAQMVDDYGDVLSRWVDDPDFLWELGPLVSEWECANGRGGEDDDDA